MTVLKKARRNVMCKILAFSHSSKIDQSHLNEMKNIITQYDPDGFGMSVMHNDGSFFDLKTLDIESELTFRKPLKLDGTIPLGFNSGQINLPESKAMILHGRMSTNEVSIECTHPFKLDCGGSFIHNGVVSDLTNLTTLKTKCDTEILSTHWSSGARSFENLATGYAAIAVLQKGLLHVARDNSAMLYIAWSDEIESYIIATTIEIIESLNYEISDINMIAPNTRLVFNGNKLESKHHFGISVTYSSGMSKLASKALDRDIDFEAFDEFKNVKKWSHRK